jgi:uncharacterized membrane protein
MNVEEQKKAEKEMWKKFKKENPKCKYFATVYGMKHELIRMEVVNEEDLSATEKAILELSGG